MRPKIVSNCKLEDTIMGKRILVVLLCALSALYITNCTSKGSSEDEESAIEESMDEGSEAAAETIPEK